MMSAARLWGLGAACALLFATGQGVEPANAQPACKDDVITVTGRGIRRQQQLEDGGSAMRDAVATWEREAESKFGEEFKSWDRARNAKFDCSPSGTLTVQCTISGSPCHNSAERREPDRVVVRDRDDDRRGERSRRNRISEPRRRDRDDDRDVRGGPTQDIRPSDSDHPCMGVNGCTPVRIFFGTDRKRKDLPERAGFGSERAGKLQLGRAIVTVPRTGRKVGEIKLPTWWERWFLKVPEGGDPERHFTIPNGGILLFDSVEKLVTAVKQQAKGRFKDHALVFVHGYNVSFDHALYRSAQLAYDLGDGPEDLFGTTFLYSWPSAGVVTGYKYDSESANFSVSHVQQFLEIVIEKTGAKNVHIIAHSMGNDPVLKALDAMRTKFPKGNKVKHLVFAAPDFDAEEFAKLAGRIRPLAETATLYVSSKDVAIRAAREAHLGFARAGDVPGGSIPVVVNDIDSIDISAISTDLLSLSHSEYADRKELLNDISAILKKGERPPNLRNINHKQQIRENKVWWRYAD